MALYFPDDDHKYDQILARMIARMSATYAAGTEGDPLYDLLSAMALELAQGADLAQNNLDRSFAQTTYGDYLTKRAEEHGVIRLDATKAKGAAVFTGTAGAVIPAGTRISTASSTTQAAAIFETDSAATIQPGNTTATVPITAVSSGTAGNVIADRITFLAAPITGITGVNNPSATTGGAEVESDSALLARYLQKVRNPSAGGNKADYVNWALEVAGVGGVAVVPVADGPGTVSVFVIGIDKRPASPELVDAVQNYISPPWRLTKPAGDLVLSGSGVSLSGSVVVMEYDAGGAGVATLPGIGATLQKPGIWTARVTCAVDDDSGTANLLQIGIWNVSAGAWAKTTDGGSVDAVTIRTALSLSEVSSVVSQQFYYDMTSNYELRITRLQADTATTLTINGIVLRSAFSQDTGEGKAPIGARVTVLAAEAVVVNISATLTILPGYEPTSVLAAAKQSIEDYLIGLAFSDDNDVRWVRVGQAILDTAGVQDYDNLLINGDDENIPISAQQVAVSGTINLT